MEEKINNDKNVYVLGAGFSKGLGLPLQDNFLLAAKEVYFQSPNRYKHFEIVFDYQNRLSKMRNFLNYPLLNLEHLFNLLEMDIFYSKKGESVKKDFIKLITDVLVNLTPGPFTYDHTFEQYRINEHYNEYISFINLFIKHASPHLSLHDDTIISFNYDLSVEIATYLNNFARFQKQKSNIQEVRLNTLFEKSNLNSVEITDFFNGDKPENYCELSSIFANDDSGIKLIKLHGSINWKDRNEQAFIVPPTWNKSDSRVRKLWNIAYEELKNAKRIIFIGYSFPDTDIYVKSLLALALNENKILQSIYFINPDTVQAKTNSLSLLDKYFHQYCEYKEWTFSYLMARQLYTVVIGNEPDNVEFIKNKLNRKLS